MTYFQKAKAILHTIVLKVIQAFILLMIAGVILWFIRGISRALAAFSGGPGEILSIKEGELVNRLAVLLLSLALFIPAASYAGTVASTYDVTFGGFVKYDLGWSSQNQPSDSPGAYRSSSSTLQFRGDEYGNTFATGAETRFNFLIKGPDLWGARTNAFIEGDFRGVTTENAYGGFQIRHAFMTLKWDSAELMIGQNWQQWGMPYYGAWLGEYDFVAYSRGVRQPQIALRYFFTKELSTMLGVISATDAYGLTEQAYDEYAISNWPGLQGEISYWTDRCGKIGANNLKFALGAYYGKHKYIDLDPANWTSWQDKTLDAWQVAFRYSIPIIPEKQNNKQYALLLNGNFFIGQDSGGAGRLLSPEVGSGTYIFWSGTDWRPEAPGYFGLFSQISWWLTDNLSVNGMYGYLKRNYSEGARAGLPDALNMQQSYAVNMLWDANQAVRFGLQWMRNFTSYNGVAAGATAASKSGTIDQYKMAAWYFF